MRFPAAATPSSAVDSSTVDSSWSQGFGPFACAIVFILYHTFLSVYAVFLPRFGGIGIVCVYVCVYNVCVLLDFFLTTAAES